MSKSINSNISSPLRSNAINSSSIGYPSIDSIWVNSGNTWVDSGNYFSNITYSQFETIEFYLFDKKYSMTSECPSNDIEFISTLNVLGWKYFVELKRNNYFNLSKRSISNSLVEFLLENEIKFDRKYKLEKINNI